MTLKKKSIIKKINNFSINFGSQHHAAHGVLRLIFVLKREVILKAERLIGILHRGTEKFIEYKTYVQALPYFNRQYYLSIMAQEHAYCLAIGLLTGLMTLWLLARTQQQTFITVLKFMPKMNIILNVLYFRQIGFKDASSLFMENSMLFNEHLPFLLIVSVFFLGWFLVCIVYNFVEYNNRYNSKFVHSKELDIIWPWLLALVFFSPWIILGESWDIPVVRLEEKWRFLEEEVVQSTEQAKCTENPLLCNSPESLNKAVFIELDNLFWSLKGYPVRRILTVLYAVPDSFWSLEFSEKLDIVLEALKLEDDIRVRREGCRVRALQIVFVACWVLFLWPSGGG
jgi:Cytochrome C oxidase subunit II, transmembrane domain